MCLNYQLGVRWDVQLPFVLPIHKTHADWVNLYLRACMNLLLRKIPGLWRVINQIETPFKKLGMREHSWKNALILICRAQWWLSVYVDIFCHPVSSRSWCYRVKTFILTDEKPWEVVTAYGSSKKYNDNAARAFGDRISCTRKTALFKFFGPDYLSTGGVYRLSCNDKGILV